MIKEGGEGEHAGEESVKLHEQFEVDIVTFGSFAVTAPHVVFVEVDT